VFAIFLADAVGARRVERIALPVLVAERALGATQGVAGEVLQALPGLPAEGHLE
jgi:hypothetical protein